jgi:hypothetical protein
MALHDKSMTQTDQPPPSTVTILKLIVTTLRPAATILRLTVTTLRPAVIILRLTVSIIRL